jgi:hypothetical protein
MIENVLKVILTCSKIVFSVFAFELEFNANANFAYTRPLIPSHQIETAFAC